MAFMTLWVVGRCSELTGNFPAGYEAASSPMWAFQGKEEGRSWHQPARWLNLQCDQKIHRLPFLLPFLPFLSLYF